MPLVHLPTPPPHIRAITDHVYFYLDRKSPLWPEFSTASAHLRNRTCTPPLPEFEALPEQLKTEAIRELERRLAAQNSNHAVVNLDSIDVDNVAGIESLVQLLAERGHRRIGFVGEPAA